MNKISVVALLALAATLSACEFAQNAVMPSVTGEPATAQPAPAAATAAPATAPEASIATPGQPGAPGSGIASDRPFVVIRFDQPEIAYQEQLYEAVSAALAHSPGVAFDLVAVAPAHGTSEEISRNSDVARAETQQVMQSLLDMGLPAERVSMTELNDPNIQGNEARLYVR